MIRLLAVLLLLASPAEAQPGVLQVTVAGVRNAKGHVLVAVCDRARFLAPHCAYSGRAAATPGAVTVLVPGIPAGIYAVEAYHDENDNDRIDRSFLGLPQEGMGFSRDAPMRFGPPAFDDAAISIPEGGGAISLTLRYFD